MVINQVYVQPKCDGFAVYALFPVNFRGCLTLNTEGAQRARFNQRIVGWIEDRKHFALADILGSLMHVRGGGSGIQTRKCQTILRQG
jgi:hypothetical protein